ncbi:MAG: hypothetical protein J6W72_06340 [Candidatus Methanomethylophilaceae archaeon]|nr:hypothetical protein [Candidatus Methanomethylophilaceae archaeon]
MSDTINHKCPFCGATLEFDIGTQKVKCPYCDNEFEPEELKKNEGDLSISDEGIELASDAGTEWSEKELYGMAEYQCQSCGGDIYSDETTSATMCPYCGNAVVLKGRLSGVLKPDLVLPFQKTKEQALQGLTDHVGSKMFVAKNFLRDNKLEEVKGLYVPFWVYDADLDADVVYDCVDVRRWTSGDTEYTERKYYKVRRAGEVAFDHVPADGSSKMPDDLMESLEPFDSGESVDFTTAYLSGYIADKYDITQEDVVPRIRQRVCEETDDRFRKTIEGYDRISMSESSINAEKSEVDYVLYPVWLFNLRWNEQKFTFAVNGQTGKIAGDLPPNKGRILITSLLFFAILMAGAWLLFSPGAPMDEIIDAMTFSTIICGIFAGTLYSMLLASLKSVEKKHGSEDYYREGSMNVSDRSEEFLYKKITTR